MFVQCQNQSQTAGTHVRDSCMWWGGETCPKMPPWRRAELFPLAQEPKPARSWGWRSLGLLYFNALSSPALLGRHNEAPRPLHEARSSVSHLTLSSSNQSWLYFGPSHYRTVTLFGRECRGRCVPLGVPLWSFFSYPSCCLKSLNKSMGTKHGWGLM